MTESFRFLVLDNSEPVHKKVLHDYATQEEIFEIFKLIDISKHNFYIAKNPKGKISFICFDVDAHGKAGEDSIETIQEKIQKLILDCKEKNKAIEINFSGRGYQIFFPVKENNYSDSKDIAEHYKFAWQKLAETLQASYFLKLDSQASDIYRVFRVPNTFNTTAQKKCEQFFKQDGELWDLEKFLKGYGTETIKKEKTIKKGTETLNDLLINPEADFSLRNKAVMIYYNLNLGKYKKKGLSKQEICADICNYLQINNKWKIYNPQDTEKYVFEFCSKNFDKPNPNQQQNAEQEYYGVKNFNPKSEIFIKKILGSAYSVFNQKYGAINSKVHYNIVVFQFGSGINKKYFLILKPFENLCLGQSEGYYRKLIVENGVVEYLSKHFLERPLLKAICEAQSISTIITENDSTRNKTMQELLESIIEKHAEKPFLFTLTNGIPNFELEKITPENWENILHDFIYSGVKKDSVIELTYKSDLIKPIPQKIKPPQFMRYQSHELVFTNSKTTKTSTARETGKLIDIARVSNLLGFATANEVVEGSLNNQVDAHTIDEIQEDSGTELFGYLNNYMELGECEVRKGKAPVKVRGYASIRWQGNPKESKATKEKNWSEQKKLNEYSEALFQKFSDCLNIVSGNYSAFGGRIAFVVFRTDLETAETTNALPLDITEKCSAVVQAVMKKASEPFTELFFDSEVLKWLNKPFSESYSESLEQIEKKATLESISEFIHGHRELAGRHTRGKALKLACVDIAIQLINKQCNREELLELAEEYLSQIEEQNLVSFSKLVDVSSEQQAMRDFLNKAFAELPQHLKILLEALQLFLLEHKEAEKVSLEEAEKVSLEELKDFFEQAKSKSEFWYPKRIIDRTTTNMMRTNKIISKFGINLAGNKNAPALQITKISIFSQIAGGN